MNTSIDSPLPPSKLAGVTTTRAYDLVMTQKLDADDFFIHCVHRNCAEARLNFFLVEPHWVAVFFVWVCFRPACHLKPLPELSV